MKIVPINNRGYFEIGFSVRDSLNDNSSILKMVVESQCLLDFIHDLVRFMDN